MVMLQDWIRLYSMNSLHQLEVLKQRRKMRHGMKVCMLSCWRVLSKYLKDPKAKDALKEATKEAAKKRKKEIQTEEDGKTASFESEVNANLIELALLLDSPICTTIWFCKAAAASSKKGKEAGHCTTC